MSLPCVVYDSGELPPLVDAAPRAVFREGDVFDRSEHPTVLQGPATRADLSTSERPVAARWGTDQARAAVRDFCRRMLA